VNCVPVAGANAFGQIGQRVPVGAPLDKCTIQEIGPVSIPSVGLEGSF
jgi:hypothetical protein